MRGCGYSLEEFEFVSCIMDVVLGYYVFEEIKPKYLWPCVTLSWSCVALSGGVPYKFDVVIRFPSVWCSPSGAFVLALEAFVFVLHL